MYRLNEKPRSPEIKVLTKRPPKTTVHKYDEVSMDVQNTIQAYMKSREGMQKFKETLGKRRKELNEEEESTREELVNHLKTKKDMQDKVELPTSKKARKERKEEEAAAAADDEIPDNDTEVDFLRFDEEFEDEKPSAPLPATKSAPMSAPASAPKEEEEDDDDDDDKTSTTYSVAIEARKRSTGKVTPLEFKDILNGCISNVLSEVFNMKDVDFVSKETVVRILESDVYWSNLFSRVNHVVAAEQSSRVDDKLVLYIRGQKKKN